MEPTFLTLEEVLLIHADQIRRYGGDTGLRDGKVLRSALAMPQMGASGEYFHGDLCEMGAAYLFHLVQNHPLVDGNKRVGTVAALVFLDLNGIEVTAGEDELVALVLGVSTGKTPKAQVAEFFRAFA